MMVTKEKHRTNRKGSHPNNPDKPGWFQRLRNPEALVLDHSYQHSHPLRTLYLLFEGSRARLAAAIGLAMIAHSVLWVMAIVSAGVINVLKSPESHPFSELVIYVMMGVIMVVQNVPVSTWSQCLLSRSVRQMESRLRGSLICRLQQLSIRFHDHYPSGRLQAKILRDVEAVHVVSRILLLNVTISVFLLIVALAITLKKEPLVALFFLVIIPLAAVLLRFFRSRITKKNTDFRVQMEHMSARVSDMLAMIPITRAHGLEQVEIKQIDNHLEGIKHKGYELDFVNQLFGASGWACFAVFQPLCLLATGFLAYTGRIPIGDVVMYQGFFTMIVGSVNTILAAYPETAKGFESLRSIGEVLECPDLEHNENKLPVDQVQGRITFENVGYTYASQSKPAIRDFSMQVQAGECIAFVGESGGGKSTIMSLVIGFHRCTQGRILLDGEDMEQLDLRSYRRFLAVVPQNTILFSGSIRENITYGLESVSDRKFQEAIEIANAAEFIHELPEGPETFVGEHGSKLSGGQRQRIAIARALIRDPKVIIFDEATSALDTVSEKLVQEAIENMIENRTTFIVAHRLSTIRKADRIVVMKNGQCQEIGSHQQLLAHNGEFSRLSRLQA